MGRDTEAKGKGTVSRMVTHILISYMLLTCIVVNWYIGYLEDRRPASNMDPYIVTSLLAETTLLWEPTLEAEALAAQKLSLNV